MSQFSYDIYVNNSVIQTLWLVYLLIRQVSKRITVGSSEPSTIYGAGFTALLAVLSHKIWTPRSIFCKIFGLPRTDFAAKSVPYHKICSPGGALYYDKYEPPLNQ